MASSIIQDKKYEETKYRHKKEVVDTSDINIKIGSKIYLEEKYYGTVIKESEIFYYIQKENAVEPYEFMKDSLKDKVANKKLRLED